MIAERTAHVVGLPEAAAAPATRARTRARGVLGAIRACVAHEFGSGDLSGLEVVVVGAGHVGERLARRLAAEGAELLVADVDPAQAGAGRASSAPAGSTRATR